MYTGILPLSKRIVHYGCIHNLEKECNILNKELGECIITDDITNLILWKCDFYICNIYINE